jgi:hypothetical protein
MDGTEKAVLIGAVAIGGYFLYENFFAAPALPADAQYAGQLPIGSLYTVPQSMSTLTAAVAGPATTALAYIYYGPAEGLYYLSYTAPTSSTPTMSGSGAAASASAAVSATGSTVTTSPAATSSTAASAPAPAVPAGPDLATIWANLQAAASATSDALYASQGGALTAYQWNTYLSIVQPTAPAGYAVSTWPPDPQVVFPNVNLATPMLPATYWAGMLPYLTTNGLSGLGCGCDTGSGLLWLLVGSALTTGLLCLLGKGRTL